MERDNRKAISRRKTLGTLAGGLIGASVAGLKAPAVHAQQANAGYAKATRKPKILLMGLDSCQMAKRMDDTSGGRKPSRLV